MYLSHRCSRHLPVAQGCVMRANQLICILITGVPFAGHGNDHIHAPHYSPAIYVEEKALYVHLGEPSYREITVWNEGLTPQHQVSTNRE